MATKGDGATRVFRTHRAFLSFVSDRRTATPPCGAAAESVRSRHTDPGVEPTSATAGHEEQYVNPSRSTAKWDNLGFARYRRYLDAFARVDRCISHAYYLEAIAILDSLIGDRLVSRVGFLVGIQVLAHENLGALCIKLIGKHNGPAGSGAETDPKFREIIAEVRELTKARNSAIHGTAKVFQPADSQVRFDELLESAAANAAEGRRLLRALDVLDTRAKRLVKKTPATHPHAFFPEKRKPASQEPATRAS